jgi:predicted TIM-barrel fold metal-dependent hydrolase
VWKNVGLGARDPAGALVLPDDERLAPVWEAAADLRIPVLIHVADPIAFFEPLDATNERWEELGAHPDWHVWPPADQEPVDGFPSFDALIDSLERVLERHPDTTFIGAHVGCAAEDLDRVSSMLAAHDNYHVDIAARLGELGRQPYTARDFFMRWADRIVFGTDVPGDPATNRIYYRFLETLDESFPYDTEDPPGQGRWRIHGLGLPDDVLRKVYADNARRLLGLPSGH